MQKYINPKAWYASKTIWAAVLGVIITAYNGLAPAFHWPSIPDQVYAVLAALGLYGLRTASQPIGAPGTPVPVVAAEGVSQASSVPATAGDAPKAQGNR